MRPVQGVIAIALLTACRAPDPGIEDPPAAVEWPTLACDPLVPQVCAYPFPNNVFTRSDETAPTGRRLELAPETMLADKQDMPADPSRWNVADGFSPGGSILAFLPGATDEGLALADRIERSLEDDSPTVILDAATGERVLHLAEIDHSTPEIERRALILTPGRRLAPASRYIVAVRGLVDADGEPVAPSPAFAALRDRSPSNEPSVEARRPLYTDIFARLEDAGVARGDLQLAWDFTTSSVENLTGDLLHMRDEALASPDPPLTIDVVDTAFDPRIAYRLEGRIEVPWYLTEPEWPGVLARGVDGRPERVEAREIEVEILIPTAALDGPLPILQYGHGVLGGKEQIESEHLLEFIDAYGYVLFAVDWIGLAAEDQAPIAFSLSEGWIDDLAITMDRLHQGTLHQLVAMRAMATAFAQDPVFGGMVDPDRRHYWGISQGGILGGVYMGATTDVQRGVLEVPGQPYQLLLLRSQEFEFFFEIMRSSWHDPREVLLGLSLVQLLWDRVEPTGWTAHVRDDTLPGTPAHDVLVRAARGDHLVTTLGAHVMARTMGLPQLDTGLGASPGLALREGPIEGSAYAEFDFGLPPDPVCNVPQPLCEDPHGKLRPLPEAREQLDRFFRTGVVENTCDGACSFPELSGCAGGESNAGLCTP
jgi:hypothetical protein